jgi:CubicO group peptidase (beta-lactamase class C family)
MKPAAFICLFLGALSTSGCFGAAGSAASAEERFAGMDAFIRQAMQRWEVPGLAIAVVKDGQLVLARGYGVCKTTEVRPTDREGLKPDGDAYGAAAPGRERGVQGEAAEPADRLVTKDTVFSIASCTKSFTAACLGMLVDEGKLHWDDTVREHLPEFAVADPYVTRHATLRDLLCHRTGLVRGDLLSVKGEFDRLEIQRRTRFLEQAAPFRTKVTYNNVMYGALGEVVARRSGLSWQEFVTQRILEPLDLESTYVSLHDVPAQRLAVRHRKYEHAVEALRQPTNDDAVAPAGALHSSVTDMARWLQFQLDLGQYNGRRLLQADTLREMHALQQSIPLKWQPDANVYRARFVGTGLGWYVRDYRGRKVVQHGGGWGADTAIVPEESLAVVVLSNLDWNLLVSMLVFDVLDAYLVGPEAAWTQGKKWDLWLGFGGHEAMYRTRDEHKSRLEKEQTAGTEPSRPLADFAGDYESDLYGRLQVRLADHRHGRCDSGGAAAARGGRDLHSRRSADDSHDLRVVPVSHPPDRPEKHKHRPSAEGVVWRVDGEDLDRAGASDDGGCRAERGACDLFQLATDFLRRQRAVWRRNRAATCDRDAICLAIPRPSPTRAWTQRRQRLSRCTAGGRAARVARAGRSVS